jgi:hypothetical protein
VSGFALVKFWLDFVASRQRDATEHTHHPFGYRTFAIAESDELELTAVATFHPPPPATRQHVGDKQLL